MLYQLSPQGSPNVCLSWGIDDSESHSVTSDSLWFHEIIQTRILEWVAFPFSRGSSNKWSNPVSHITGGFLTNWAIRKATEVAQSCATVCNPMDHSLPGSSIYETFQARVLEWFAISFSRGISQPGNRTWVSHMADALPTEPPGKPFFLNVVAIHLHPQTQEI